jgi:hypothetical protein
MTQTTADAFRAACEATEAFRAAIAALNLAIQGEDEAFDWDAINRANIAVSDGLTPFAAWVLRAL